MVTTLFKRQKINDLLLYVQPTNQFSFNSLYSIHSYTADTNMFSKEKNT